MIPLAEAARKAEAWRRAPSSGPRRPGAVSFFVRTEGPAWPAHKLEWLRKLKTDGGRRNG